MLWITFYIVMLWNKSVSFHGTMMDKKRLSLADKIQLLLLYLLTNCFFCCQRSIVMANTWADTVKQAKSCNVAPTFTVSATWQHWTLVQTKAEVITLLLYPLTMSWGWHCHLWLKKRISYTNQLLFSILCYKVSSYDYAALWGLISRKTHIIELSKNIFLCIAW